MQCCDTHQKTGANMNIDIRHWAFAAPQRSALVIDGQHTRYGELEATVNRVARLFARHKLERGDHVAALLPNGPWALVMAWAAWRSGVYFTPVPNALSAQDAAAIVRDCRARVLLIDSAYADLAAGMQGSLPDGLVCYSCTGGIAGLPTIEAAIMQLPGTPRDDESPGALMLYTSGTTGAPKGVWRPLPDPSYAGPPTFAADLISLFGMDASMRYLSPAPLYHAAPLRFSLSVTAAGGTVFAMRKFDASSALRMLAEHRITHSQWVPTMMQRMLHLPQQERDAFRAPDHRVAIHAAAPCPPPLKRAMIDWWGPILLEYYAGSEGVGSTVIDSHEWLRRPGSVGRAKRGTIHVIDDDSNELPSGKVGRIFFSGLSPFRYFDAPEKTAARTSPQGWQTLGDLGWIDEEGYLYLTDRMDDMIISGGVNLYPQEIEAALLESPLIADCGVVGMPDPDFGERAVAFVSLRDGTNGDHAPILEALESFARERLGRIKRPSRFVIVDELPRSTAGKLLRRKLRDEAG